MLVEPMKTSVFSALLSLLLASGGGGEGASQQLRTKAAEGDGLLSVDAEQVPSASRVIVRVTIVNRTSDRMVWINSRPRVGTASFGARDSEIEMSIIDSHRRKVTELCEALPGVPDRTRFIVLRPKEKTVITYDLDPRCYSLVPGEKLLVQLTYRATKDWPKPEPGIDLPTEAVGLNAWKKVVVPNGWQDTATPHL
jgi:hypothetical protein